MSVKDRREHRLPAYRRRAVMVVAALIVPFAAATPALASVPGSHNLSPQSPASPSVIHENPAATLARGHTRVDWQRDIAKVPALKAGCYHASYPSLRWHAVRCKVAPRFPMLPSAAPKAVGNGTDYSAKVSGTISEATGVFDNV